MDVRTASPVEIDAALAEIYTRLAPLETRLWAATDRARAIASRTPVDQEHYARALAAKDAAAAAYRRVEAETAPYEAEYDRRGGWSRAWLCLAAGGHVHNSRSCSTCYPRTQFGWLPGLSGMSDTTAVELIGSDLCSVCWPDAPVIAKPRSVFHSSEIEAQAARSAREARKAEIAAKRERNALGVTVRGPHGKIVTLTEAKQTLTDAYAWLNHPYYADGTLVDALVAAIAIKTGDDPAEIKAAAAKRASKRK